MLHIGPGSILSLITTLHIFCSHWLLELINTPIMTRNLPSSIPPRLSTVLITTDQVAKLLLSSLHYCLNLLKSCQLNPACRKTKTFLARQSN